MSSCMQRRLREETCLSTWRVLKNFLTTSTCWEGIVNYPFCRYPIHVVRKFFFVSDKTCLSWGNFSSWGTRLACREEIFLREGPTLLVVRKFFFVRDIDLLVVRKFFFVRDLEAFSWILWLLFTIRKRHFLGLLDFSTGFENGIIDYNN